MAHNPFYKVYAHNAAKTGVQTSALTVTASHLFSQIKDSCHLKGL